MPENKGTTDDELLANAIPIDDLEDDADQLQIEDSEAEDMEPIDLAEASSDGDSGASKIRQFGKQGRHEDKWNRQPNVTGQGAIHVKTFVAKLRLDAMDNLDDQVNQWLDQNPEYEVKFVTTSVGDLKGKLTEQALFMNVWV